MCADFDGLIVLIFGATYDTILVELQLLLMILCTRFYLYLTQRNKKSSFLLEYIGNINIINIISPELSNNTLDLDSMIIFKKDILSIYSFNDLHPHSFKCP